MKYNFENLYEHVGYLFYGMVSREGKISATDLLKLNEFVDRTWKPGVAGDPMLSAHLVDCIHRGIRYGSINGMSTLHALDSFKGYFILHALGFDDALREKILSSVQTIQREFSENPQANDIDKVLGRLFAGRSVVV